MTQVLSHARIDHVYGVRRVRRFGVVFTHSVAYNGSAIACKRNTLTLGSKEKSLFIPTWCLPPRRRLPSRRRRACWWIRGVPPPASLWVDTLGAFIVPSEWLTWSLSNLLTGMESCVSFARLLKKVVLWLFCLLGNLPDDFLDSLDVTCWAQGPKYFHVWCALPPERYRSDLLPQSHPGVRSVLRSIRCRFVIVDNESCSRIYPVWNCVPFSLPLLMRHGLHGGLILCLTVFPWRAPWDGPFLMT